MKNHSVLASLKSALATIAILSTLASPQAIAANPKKSRISNDIAALRGHVAKAVIYIGPEQWTFNLARKESDLPIISCEYILTEADSLSTLISILERGKFAKHPAPHQMDVRVGVYLHRTDGEVRKIILNASELNAGMRGKYNDRTAILSSPMFEKELRAFTATLQQTKPNYYCDSEKSAPVKDIPKTVPEPDEAGAK
ncbi:hypothetical protein [Massilia violaceinigra]|uniref:hypothetical protein n=1 Tax=Massilia violaceinigra TaxID=2045208 RepID=UPI0012FDA169|nr:hypothetical protein [Massilia violaceinigra]